MSKRKVEQEPIDNTKIAANIIPTEIPKFMIESYYQYISYIASGRVNCNIMDGFKNIHRRILYAALQICRNNNVKSAKLQGEVTGTYSPHGDCYESIVGVVNDGLLIGQGGFGNNKGVEKERAGAQRYTEVRLNPITEVLFMNKELMPYVDYIESELSTLEKKYYEPLYLPVLLPGIFVGITDNCEFDSGMALKLSFKYPRYAVMTLLNYVITYLETGEFKPELLYYQYHNMIKRADNDVKSSIDVTFRAPIKVDDDNNIHLLCTLPFVNMETLLSSIPFEDHTSNKTDIVFDKKYYTKKFESTVHFNSKAYKVINNDYENVVLYDYPVRYAIEIILNNLKKILFPRYFTDKESKIREQIKEFELLKIVRTKYVDNKIAFEKLTDEEKACAGRHSSSTFMTIEKKLDKLNEDLKILLKRAKNIDNEILALYKDAKIKVQEYLQKYYKDNDVTIYDVTNS